MYTVSYPEDPEQDFLTLLKVGFLLTLVTFLCILLPWYGVLYYSPWFLILAIPSTIGAWASIYYILEPLLSEY